MAIATPPGSKQHQEEDFYPSSDGKPMAETDKHVDLILGCKATLQLYFADRPEVYVSGNNFIYYEEGNPKARVSPDGYVVFGAGMHPRDSYMAWKEGGLLPSVVFEFTSRSTCKEDMVDKRALYERVLCVDEYFLFDPTGDYLNPRLQGFHLVEGRYVPLELKENRLHSERLGLDLVWAGESLRFYDPVRNTRLPTLLESEQRADAEAQRAEEWAQRAETSMQMVEEWKQRAEAEAQRAGTAIQLAGEWAQQAELEKQRAEAEAAARTLEKQRADASEAETARLRAQMEALRKQEN